MNSHSRRSPSDECRNIEKIELITLSSDDEDETEERESVATTMTAEDSGFHPCSSMSTCTSYNGSSSTTSTARSTCSSPTFIAPFAPCPTYPQQSAFTTCNISTLDCFATSYLSDSALTTAYMSGDDDLEDEPQPSISRMFHETDSPNCPEIPDRLNVTVTLGSNKKRLQDSSVRNVARKSIQKKKALGSTVSSSSPADASSDPPARRQCPTCRKKFANLPQHQKRSPNCKPGLKEPAVLQQKRCRFCHEVDFQFDTVLETKRHYRHFHLATCIQCAEKFPTAHQRANHEREVHRLQYSLDSDSETTPEFQRSQSYQITSQSKKGNKVSSKKTAPKTRTSSEDTPISNSEYRLSFLPSLPSPSLPSSLQSLAEETTVQPSHQNERVPVETSEMESTDSNNTPRTSALPEAAVQAKDFEESLLCVPKISRHLCKTVKTTPKFNTVGRLPFSALNVSTAVTESQIQTFSAQPRQISCVASFHQSDATTKCDKENFVIQFQTTIDAIDCLQEQIVEIPEMKHHIAHSQLYKFKSGKASNTSITVKGTAEAKVCEPPLETVSELPPHTNEAHANWRYLSPGQDRIIIKVNEPPHILEPEQKSSSTAPPEPKGLKIDPVFLQFFSNYNPNSGSSSDEKIVAPALPPPTPSSSKANFVSIQKGKDYKKSSSEPIRTFKMTARKTVQRKAEKNTEKTKNSVKLKSCNSLKSQEAPMTQDLSNTQHKLKTQDRNIPDTSKTLGTSNTEEVSRTQVTSKSLDASITQKISNSQVMSKTLDASITHKISKSQVMSKTLDASITRKISKSQVMSKTLDASITQKISKSQVMSKTLDASITQEISKSQDASKTLDASITQMISKSQDASKTLDASITQKISKSQVMSKTLDASITQEISKSQDASKTLDASITQEEISKSQDASKTLDASITQMISKSQDASKTLDASITQKISKSQVMSKTLDASITQEISKSQDASKTLDASITQKISKSQVTSKTLNASITQEISKSQDASKTLDASITQKISKSQVTSKTLNASITQEISKSQDASKTLDASITQKISKSQVMSKTLDASITQEISKSQDASKTLDASITQKISKSQVTPKTLNASITQEISKSQDASKTLDGSISQKISKSQVTPKTLNASITQEISKPLDASKNLDTLKMQDNLSILDAPQTPDSSKTKVKSQTQDTLKSQVTLKNQPVSTAVAEIGTTAAVDTSTSPPLLELLLQTSSALMTEMKSPEYHRPYPREYPDRPSAESQAETGTSPEPKKSSAPGNSPVNYFFQNKEKKNYPQDRKNERQGEKTNKGAQNKKNEWLDKRNESQYKKSHPQHKKNAPLAKNNERRSEYDTTSKGVAIDLSKPFGSIRVKKIMNEMKKSLAGVQQTKHGRKKYFEHNHSMRRIIDEHKKSSTKLSQLKKQEHRKLDDTVIRHFTKITRHEHSYPNYYNALVRRREDASNSAHQMRGTSTEKSCEVKYTVSELCVTPIQTSSNSTPPLPTTDRAELPPPPPPPPLPKFLRFKLLNTSSKSSLRTDEINIENKNLSRAVTPTLDEPDRSGAVTPTLDEPEEEPPALKKVKLSSSETARTCKQVPSTMNDANNNLKKYRVGCEISLPRSHPLNCATKEEQPSPTKPLVIDLEEEDGIEIVVDLTDSDDECDSTILLSPTTPERKNNVFQQPLDSEVQKISSIKSSKKSAPYTQKNSKATGTDKKVDAGIISNDSSTRVEKISDCARKRTNKTTEIDHHTLNFKSTKSSNCGMENHSDSGSRRNSDVDLRNIVKHRKMTAEFPISRTAGSVDPTSTKASLTDSEKLSKSEKEVSSSFKAANSSNPAAVEMENSVKVKTSIIGESVKISGPLKRSSDGIEKILDLGKQFSESELCADPRKRKRDVLCERIKESKSSNSGLRGVSINELETVFDSGKQESSSSRGIAKISNPGLPNPAAVENSIKVKTSVIGETVKSSETQKGSSDEIEKISDLGKQKIGEFEVFTEPVKKKSDDKEVLHEKKKDSLVGHQTSLSKITTQGNYVSKQNEEDMGLASRKTGQRTEANCDQMPPTEVEAPKTKPISSLSALKRKLAVASEPVNQTEHSCVESSLCPKSCRSIEMNKSNKLLTVSIHNVGPPAPKSKSPVRPLTISPSKSPVINRIIPPAPKPIIIKADHCELCQKQFDQIEEHLVRCHSPGPCKTKMWGRDSEYCCGLYFPRFNFGKHHKRHHYNPPPGSSEHQCNKCKRKFAKYGYLIDHLVYDHNVCSKPFMDVASSKDKYYSRIRATPKTKNSSADFT